MTVNLVTGGLGFLGSYVVRRFVAMGEAVIALDVSGNTTLVRDVLDRMKVVRSNSSNWVAVADIVKQNEVDSIFHVGALAPPRRRTVHHSLSIVAGELRDEVKKQMPQAQLDMVPDPDTSAIIKTMPRLDDSSARQDWNWYPRFSDVAGYVADWITEGKSRPHTYRCAKGFW